MHCYANYESCEKSFKITTSIFCKQKCYNRETTDSNLKPNLKARRVSTITGDL